MGNPTHLPLSHPFCWCRTHAPACLAWATTALRPPNLNHHCSTELQPPNLSYHCSTDLQPPNLSHHCSTDLQPPNLSYHCSTVLRPTNLNHHCSTDLQPLITMKLPPPTIIYMCLCTVNKWQHPAHTQCWLSELFKGLTGRFSPPGKKLCPNGFSGLLQMINFIIIMCTCHLTSLAHTYGLRRRICTYVGGSFVTICSWINYVRSLMYMYSYVRSLMYMYSWISTLIDRPWVPVGDVGERRGRGNFGNRNCIILTSTNQKVATVVEESSYIVVVRVLYNFPCSVSSWAGFHTEGGGGGASFPYQKILATIIMYYVYIILDIFRFSYNTYTKPITTLIH